MSATAQIGVMGKHPGFGDFVQSGLDKPVHEALEGWLNAALSQLKAQTEEEGNWSHWWDATQSLRFWIGRDVLGVPLAGVLRPSRDKVGRLYPLLLVAQNVALPPPGEGDETEQLPWEQLEAHLDAVAPGNGAASLLDGLTLDLPAEDAAARGLGHTIWAHHPEGDLQALLRAAARADVARAALRRSYWWAAGTQTHLPVWLGCDGLPDAGALGWLLAGQIRIGELDGV